MPLARPGKQKLQSFDLAWTFLLTGEGLTSASGEFEPDKLSTAHNEKSLYIEP